MVCYKTTANKINIYARVYAMCHYGEVSPMLVLDTKPVLSKLLLARPTPQYLLNVIC